MAEQSIVEAALREAAFVLSCGGWVRAEPWMKYCRPSSVWFPDHDEGAVAGVELYVPISDLPALLRFKETAAKFSVVCAGAASITDSLAAAHLEITRLVKDVNHFQGCFDAAVAGRDRLADELAIKERQLDSITSTALDLRKEVERLAKKVAALMRGHNAILDIDNGDEGHCPCCCDKDQEAQTALNATKALQGGGKSE